MDSAKFLSRKESQTVLDNIARQARTVTNNDIDFIHAVGRTLLPRFWIPEPQFVQPQELGDIASRDGVYFNGANKAEFHEQIRRGRILYWQEYGRAHNISDHKELFDHWLKQNKRFSRRTPRQMYEQQFLGLHGGCGGYVAVMTDILRSAGMPVKIVYFVRQSLPEDGFEPPGHYMGACLADGAWRLYDFKWQWNPKLSHLFLGQERGVTNPRHRADQRIKYVPFTNNQVYTPSEPIASDNIGLVDIDYGLDAAPFFQDALRKHAFDSN